MGLYWARFRTCKKASVLFILLFISLILIWSWCSFEGYSYSRFYFPLLPFLASFLQPNKHLEININIRLLPEICFILRSKTIKNSHISFKHENVSHESDVTEKLMSADLAQLLSQAETTWLKSIKETLKPCVQR